ncbi:MAG: cation transporter [Clostridia bacterium]|nr:cation transporter [Clostridia bacterium]
MTELISKLFVKNHKDYKNPDVRKKYGTVSSGVGIVTNLILALIKLFAGLLASSMAIVADAFNNLSDAGSSLITLISFKLSAKPADKEHPFGHARFEYIASMIVSFLILLVGFELFSGSFEVVLGLSESENTVINNLTFIILAISIGLKLWLGIFYRKIGKKIDSKMILATSLDSLTDSISTGAVLASSIIIKLTGFVILDAIVGIGVSVIIIVAGIKILNETKNALLGEAPVQEIVDDIKNVVEQYPDIIGMHDLLVHNYGPGRFIASFHAEVDGAKDIYMLHDMIDNAEREIKEKLGIACTIHLDPIATDDEDVMRLRQFIDEVMAELGFNYHIHDFRVVIGNTHTNLIFDVVLPFDSSVTEKELVSKIESIVSEKKPNHFCVITVDRE